jgi:hypothetical protein
MPLLGWLSLPQKIRVRLLYEIRTIDVKTQNHYEIVRTSSFQQVRITHFCRYASHLQ